MTFKECIEGSDYAVVCICMNEDGDGNRVWERQQVPTYIQDSRHRRWIFEKEDLKTIFVNASRHVMDLPFFGHPGIHAISQTYYILDVRGIGLIGLLRAEGQLLLSVSGSLSWSSKEMAEYSLKRHPILQVGLVVQKPDGDAGQIVDDVVHLCRCAPAIMTAQPPEAVQPIFYVFDFHIYEISISENIGGSR